jgi:hypothetical protein
MQNQKTIYAFQVGEAHSQVVGTDGLAAGPPNLKCLNQNCGYKRRVVTSMMLSAFEKQKPQIVRTQSKITRIKQEKTQSYTSLQGASNEYRLSTKL